MISTTTNIHEELVEALQLLIDAKDYKEQFGKDSLYESKKSRAWNKARKTLAKAKGES